MSAGYRDHPRRTAAVEALTAQIAEETVDDQLHDTGVLGNPRYDNDTERARLAEIYRPASRQRAERYYEVVAAVLDGPPHPGMRAVGEGIYRVSPSRRARSAITGRFRKPTPPEEA